MIPFFFPQNTCAQSINVHTVSLQPEWKNSKNSSLGKTSRDKMTMSVHERESDRRVGEGILCKHSPCRRTARSLVVIPLFSLTEAQDECMNECEKKQRE